MLFSLPFQLSVGALSPVYAASRLPVLPMEGLSPGSCQPVMQALQSAGLMPRLIENEDFLFTITPRSHRYVAIILGQHLRSDTLALLHRYVAGGGKLVLLSSAEPTPDASVQQLFNLVGLPAASLIESGQALTLHRHDTAIQPLVEPTAEQLPAHTKLLRLSTPSNLQVVATWGDTLPAIVKTRQATLLNWPWGRQLSETANRMALAQAMPLAPPNSFIFLSHHEQNAAQHTGKNAHPPTHVSMTGHPDRSTPLGPNATANPTLSAQPSPSPAKPSPADASTPEASSIVIPPSGSPTPAPAASSAFHLSRPSEPASASSPQKSAGQGSPPPAAASAVAAGKSKSSTPAGKPAAKAPGNQKAAGNNQQDMETEVLNNILGTPGNDADNPGTPAGSALKPGDESKQKHFSFLDPEAASVLAPEFDYGVYSMNLRIFDDYRRKVNEGIEMARQLSLTIPEQKINSLLQEATAHRKKFESLYLSNQTTAGLQAFSQSYRTLLQALALTTDSPRVEGRAIWLDRSTIIDAGNPEGLKKRMQKLHQAGINIVYFETLNAGFPIYPSEILRRNPMVQGWDPLKVAIEEGHRLGMEVHAWVWTFAVGNRRHNPLIGMPADYAGPILNEGGMMSEALRNRDGGLAVDGRQNEFWLSPASPKAREFLLKVYKEIVTRYDVDGLQLDYIRYPFQTAGTRMGFEAVGRERFSQATGASVDNLDDYASRVWIAWKTYQVSSFVQQVSSTLKAIKPNLKLSAAVFPMRRASRIVAIQQDWETWVDNGWVDTLSPMSYTSDPQRLQAMFESVQSSPQKHPLIYPGVALHRLDGGQLVMQLEALREKGSLGATLFAGAHLDADKAETLGTGPFKAWDALPPHRDVLKCLRLLTADYQQKLELLQTKGTLQNTPPEQISALMAALIQFNQALTALGPSSEGASTNITLPKLKDAQQALQNLQTVSQTWETTDKATYSLRSQYFQKNRILLSELLGYLSDRYSAPTASFQGPGAHSTVSHARPAEQPPSVTQPRPVASTQPAFASHDEMEAEEDTPTQKANIPGP